MYGKYKKTILAKSKASYDETKVEYDKYFAMQQALKTNLDEMPKGCEHIPSANSEIKYLIDGNAILLQAESDINEVTKDVDIDDRTLVDQFEENEKKHSVLLDNLPNINKNLAGAIVLLVIGLPLIFFYMLTMIIKKDMIPYPTPIIPYAILILGSILALIGVLLLIFFIVSIFNYKAELDDRNDIADELISSNHDLKLAFEGETLKFDNTLKAVIAIENDAFKKMKEIPNKGGSLFLIRDYIALAVYYIYIERANNVPDALNIVFEDKKHAELLAKLGDNSPYFETIIKEIRNQNKISIAALTGGDINIE